MSTAIQLYQGTNSELMLSANSTGVRLTSVERRILSIDGNRTIAESDGETLRKEVRAILVGVFRDLGIVRQPDAFDATRLLDILKEYYGDMSTAEIKQAFELYAVGELNDHLPHDSKGQALQHFQQFSAMFYTQVIRAYRQRRSEAKKDVSGRVGVKLLEQKQAERDPYQDRATFYTVLRSVCTDIAHGNDPVFVITIEAESVLTKLKFLPASIVPTDYDVRTARSRMTRGRDAAVDESLGSLIEAGLVPEDLQHLARTVSVRRQLYQCLRELGPDEVGRRFAWLIDRHQQSKVNP